MGIYKYGITPSSIAVRKRDRARHTMSNMVSAHEDEARRRHAKFSNLGWAVTGTGMASKTDQGILETEWDSETESYCHEWIRR